MLIEYIERMRKEPPDVKRRVVHLWTIVVMAVILLLYIVGMVVSNFFFDGAVFESRTDSIAAPYEAERIAP
ncbi:MAG: hypothetical protein NBV63_00830 [Candidatus Pacebacteria bacterium]|jgi:hypothetical protein|nr:hypothetical protein [Candidatus Paceibacterota bacterium]